MPAHSHAMPIRVNTVHVSALISAAIRSHTVLVNLLRWKYFVLFHLRWHRYSGKRFCRNDIKYFHKTRLEQGMNVSVRNVQKSVRGERYEWKSMMSVNDSSLSFSFSRSKSSLIQSFEWVFAWMDEQSIGSYVDREPLAIYGPLRPFETFYKWQTTSINYKCRPKMNNQFGHTYFFYQFLSF